MLYINPREKKSVDQLLEIQVHPVEVKTNMWEPIQHGKLVECLLETSEEMGLEVLDQSWYVKRAGQIFYGSIDYKLGVVVAEDRSVDNLVMSMTMRHSNDGRYSLSFMPGARVESSRTGFMIKDIALVRKHTAKVVLRDTVEDGLQELLAEADPICDAVEAMRRYRIDDREASFVLVRLAQYEVIGFRLIESIWEQWRHPSESEFKPRTAWSLYHCVMQVIKHQAPNRQVYVLRSLYHSMKQILEPGKSA